MSASRNSSNATHPATPVVSVFNATISNSTFANWGCECHNNKALPLLLLVKRSFFILAHVPLQLAKWVGRRSLPGPLEAQLGVW